MDDIFGNAAVLIHMASLLYVIAFLVRDQLWLRLLVLVATLLYIGYYYFVPEEPLWDAIAWSVVLGLANLYITLQIVLERTTYSLSEEEKKLYDAFDTMTPGEFRKMLKIGTWHDGDGVTRLTTENATNENLYFVLHGESVVEKSGRSFPIPERVFVGEVAYFLKCHASATVTVPRGGRYISWPRQALETLERKNPGIRVALQSLMNTDMAGKVAAS
ncbi:MAG: hypothetical protein ACR2O4_15405 [Hyphomicrobiaceae bacterium]